MPDTNKKKIRRATIIYWMMLSYIVAALVWWFISLERQNDMMRDFKIRQLAATVDSTVSPGMYYIESWKVDNEHSRNRTKHASEGIVFLVLILVGAAFVYRSVRRQFRVQQQQQNFMMAVTHELKTPIAVASLNLETVQKRNLDPDKQKKLLSMTLKEMGRLNFLTNNILVASQLEGGGYKLSREEIDLSDLLKDCLQNFRARFPERLINEHIDADVELKGDPLLLQMLINNLLENANKYSPRQTPITVSLSAASASISLQIMDEGEGIPDSEKSRIFDKFYRVGNEATRKTQGTGLGLYLCSKIAKDHNADISVTNHLPRGSNFVVTFHI